jgi:hypothetical protein
MKHNDGRHLITIGFKLGLQRLQYLLLFQGIGGLPVLVK